MCDPNHNCPDSKLEAGLGAGRKRLPEHCRRCRLEAGKAEDRDCGGEAASWFGVGRTARDCVDTVGRSPYDQGCYRVEGRSCK